MIRTKKNREDGTEEKRVEWRKIGGGSFRMKNGRIIKPNQTFFAALSDIPQAFRDVVVPLEALPEEEPLEVFTGKYKVQERDKKGWYDVLSPTGKVVSESALRLAEAEKMAEELG